MDHNELLKSLGLTHKESEIYLAALSLGPSSVLSLSKATLVHRTLVYEVLDKLIAKGLMTTTVKGKRKLYLAVEPKDLLGYVHNLESRVKAALPELTALSYAGKQKPVISYYEGREQLQQLFRTGVECKSKQMCSFFPSKYMAELLGKEEMERSIQARINRGIFVKTLRSREGEVPFRTSDLIDQAHREVRYLPKEYEPEMGIVIFDDTVNLFSPIEENYGIQIRSKAYTQLMLCFFDNLWKHSEVRV